jgi:hypothetical protein
MIIEVINQSRRPTSDRSASERRQARLAIPFCRCGTSVCNTYGAKVDDQLDKRVGRHLFRRMLRCVHAP